jgi:hypothetical protein
MAFATVCKPFPTFFTIKDKKRGKNRKRRKKEEKAMSQKDAKGAAPFPGAWSWQVTHIGTVDHIHFYTFPNYFLSDVCTHINGCW